jgi:hypothetical protein
MEENKEVFRFEDFLSGSKLDDLKKMKQNLFEGGVFEELESLEELEEEDDVDAFSEEEREEDDDDVIDLSMNPYKIAESLEGVEEDGEEDDEEDIKLPFAKEEEQEDGEEDEDENLYESSETDAYKLYRDKAEEFVCDIAIEGVSQSDTEVRLIVESEDWTLMFEGEIKKGKCVIPIKKLSILNEGQTGRIRLEVNADGNLFTPWEDEFVVKVSKKVTVKMNESKTAKPKPAKKAPGVKVRVNK